MGPLSDLRLDRTARDDVAEEDCAVLETVDAIRVLAEVDELRRWRVDEDVRRGCRHLERAWRKAGRAQADLLNAPDRGEQRQGQAHDDARLEPPERSQADPD